MLLTISVSDFRERYKLIKIGPSSVLLTFKKHLRGCFSIVDGFLPISFVMGQVIENSFLGNKLQFKGNNATKFHVS